MAVTAETVQIIVDVKGDKALKGLNDNKKASSKLFDTFKKLAGPVAIGAVVAGMVKMGKVAAKAASDAEEIESKYNIVFRSISSEASEMADSLAEDFDLAGSTAQKLLGNTGDLLTGFDLAQGSALQLADATNRLALDLGSLQNAHPEEVSSALISAFTGEREALKTYGIVISEAMVKAEMLKQAKDGLIFSSEQEAKIQATLAIATNQSKNAIGNYALTADSAANTQRRLEQSTKALAEAYGENLNEAITPLKALFADFASGMAEVIASQNTASDVMKQVSQGADLATFSLDELKEAMAGIESQRKGGTTNRADVELYRQLQTYIEGVEKLGELNEVQSAKQEIRNKRAAEGIQKLLARKAEEQKIQESINAVYQDTDEFQKQQLQTQITLFESYNQNLPGITASLALLNEELESMSEVTQEIDNSGEQALEKMQERAARNVEIFNMVKSAKLEQQAEMTRIEDEEAAKREERARLEAAAKESLLRSGFSIASDLVKLGGDESKTAAERRFKITKALATGETAINTARAIGEASPNPFAIAAAAALGAAQLVKIHTQAMPSFATGGSHTTSGEEMIKVGDNASGREKVTVDSTGGRGSGGATILNIDGTQFTAWINNQFDNGTIRVPRRQIV